MIHGFARRVRVLGAAAAAFLTLAILAHSKPALAQSSPNAIPDGNGNGFDTHLFRPAMDSKGLFTVNGSDVLGANESASASSSTTRTSCFVLRRVDGALIDHSFQGTFQFNYGLFNQLVVGVDVPVDLMSGGARVRPGERCGSGRRRRSNFQGVGYLGVAREVAHHPRRAGVRPRARAADR